MNILLQLLINVIIEFPEEILKIAKHFSLCINFSMHRSLIKSKFGDLAILSLLKKNNPTFYDITMRDNLHTVNPRGKRFQARH